MRSIADSMAGMSAGGRKPGLSDSMGRSEEARAPESEGDGKKSVLHDHGDGTFHTVTSDGEETNHPSIEHATAHMAAHHEPDGKHFHVHQDGAGNHSSAQAEDGEKSEGPHDHANMEELKDNMERFLTEEEHEGNEYSRGGEGGGERHGNALFG